MLALEGPLALRREATLRFIRAAVELDLPTADALAEAGVPRWDAQEALRRLAGAGELGATGWQSASRTAYRSLLSDLGRDDSEPLVAQPRLSYAL